MVIFNSYVTNYQRVYIYIYLYNHMYIRSVQSQYIQDFFQYIKVINYKCID